LLGGGSSLAYRAINISNKPEWWLIEGSFNYI